jgi:outer membrane protein TolC
MQIFRYVVALSVSAAFNLNYLELAIAQKVPNSFQPSTNSTSDQTTQKSGLLEPDPNPLQLPTKPDEVKLQETQAITLQQAIELARRNNRDLQVAQLELHRNQAALRQAQAARYPTLRSEAELGYERPAQDRLENLEFLDEDASSTGFLNGTVELSYNLFTFGRRSAQIRAAQEQVRFDQLEVDRLHEQIRLDVANTYYNLQQAGEQVRITQAAVTNAQRNLQDTIALEEGGIGTKLDITRARVQLGNAEQELIDAQNEQEIARRELVQLLSLGELADVSAADPVQPAGEWALSLEESIVLAYKNRAEFQQQLAQRNISEQRRRAALADVRPQISLFANYQVVDEFNEEFGLLDGYAVGARLNWNFFDGGAARAAARQEEANRTIAETRFAQTRNQVRFQVEQAYKNLQANTRSIQTATAALKEAQNALDIIQFRFQQGIGTQLDVITAQNDLTRADVNRLRAVLNYNRALAALQRAVSNLTANPSQLYNKAFEL